MSKKKDNEVSWLDKESDRASNLVKTGKEVNNPSAIKTDSVNIETEVNYLRIKLKPTVEQRFRYAISLAQGDAIKNGVKKPTMGNVFDEMVTLYEKEKNIK